jgi:hypothetical protein
VDAEIRNRGRFTIYAYLRDPSAVEDLEIAVASISPEETVMIHVTDGLALSLAESTARTSPVPPKGDLS